MHPGHEQLHRHNQENQGGDGEELPEVHLEAALEEGHAQSDGQRQADHAPDEIHERGGAQRDGGEKQHRFGALAKDHEKHEQEQPPRCPPTGRARFTRQARKLGLNLLLQALARPPHPDRHGGHKHRARQHQPALVGVAELRQLQGVEYEPERKARPHGCQQRPVDDPVCTRAPSLLKVSGHYPHDEGRFHPFAQRDNE